MTDTPTNANNPAPSDDPMLTAYALGELDPSSDEYKAVQARLADDPALREQVGQIAAVGKQLHTSYHAEQGPGLTAAALDSLTDAAGSAAGSAASPRAVRPPVIARLLPYAGVAACAALATALIINPWGKPDPPTVVNVTGDETGSEQIDDPAKTPSVPEPPAPKPGPFDVRVTLEDANASLSDVLALIREKTGQNIVVNWPQLELVGIEQDSLVTLPIKDVRAGELLRLALEQVSFDAFDDDKAGVRFTQEYAKISTLRDLKSDTETRLYDISPLLARGSAMPRLQMELKERLAFLDEQDAPTSGGGLFGDDDTNTRFSHAAGTQPGIRANLGTTIQSRRNKSGGDLFGGASAPTTPSFRNAPGFDLNDELRRSGKAQAERDQSGNIALGPGGGRGGQNPSTNGVVLFSDGGFESGHVVPAEANKPIRFPSALTLVQDLSNEEMIDQLTDAIQNNIGDPDEWLDEESTLTEVDGNMIIKTTPENHAHIQRLLNQFNHQANQGDEGLDRLAAMLIRDIEGGIVTIEERRRLRQIEALGQDRFDTLKDNPFKLATHEPLSTFSVDVDTASYAFCRRTLMTGGTLPPADAVRIEEWVNYFSYDYPAPIVETDDLENGRLTTAALEKLEAQDKSFTPFTTDVEVTTCPWAQGHKLMRVGIKAMEVDLSDRPAAHLVFLLDVSGSMSSMDKIGLVKRGLPMLLEQLKEGDKVSIVVYAGASGLVLEAADAQDKGAIIEAIERLNAGGSTAGAAGIQLAYDVAEKHYVPGGVNRVILCTDGDFNVGTSGTGELVDLVTQKANPKPEQGEKPKGVYLSVMGFGRGNLNDEMMEKISNAGNGNYSYIDSVDEAVKTMSQQAGGTLITVAKDVKLQLEFNPAQVASYRLIGYENRVLRDEDFNDDTVDAGDIGAGHTVTALYEIVPAAQKQEAEQEADIDDLRYQMPRKLADKAKQAELLTLKLRFKPVDAAAEQGTSRKIELHVPAEATKFDLASESTRFASSVAAMGMLLRGSPHSGEANFQWVVDTAEAASAHDPHGHRKQFVQMINTAIRLERDKVQQHLGE